MKIETTIIALMAAGWLAGCQSVPLAENAAQLGVKFEWPKKSGCGMVSPEILVTNIPAGTRYLKADMTDLDMPSYPHGGGLVEYSGTGKIAAGALKSFEGPCPPGGAHRYEFIVRALNAEKTVALGEGKAMRSYPE